MKYFSFFILISLILSTGQSKPIEEKNFQDDSKEAVQAAFKKLSSDLVESLEKIVDKLSKEKREIESANVKYHRDQLASSLFRNFLVEQIDFMFSNKQYWTTPSFVDKLNLKDQSTKQISKIIDTDLTKIFDSIVRGLIKDKIDAIQVERAELCRYGWETTVTYYFAYGLSLFEKYK